MLQRLRRTAFDLGVGRLHGAYGDTNVSMAGCVGTELALRDRRNENNPLIRHEWSNMDTNLNSSHLLELLVQA